MDEQRAGRQLHRYRSKVALLTKLLTNARPALAAYARQANDPFYDKLVSDIDSAIGNPPAFKPDNRSA